MHRSYLISFRVGFLPKHRTQITQLAIRTLEDKTSSARRYAIQLLKELLDTHPFAEHPKGPEFAANLDLESWQEAYEQACAGLEKVDAAELAKARKDAGLPEEDEDEEEDAEAGATEEDEEGAPRRRKSRGGRDGAEDEEGDDDVETPRPKDKKKRRQPRVSAADIAAVMSDPNPVFDPQEVAILRVQQKYYGDAARFAAQIEEAIPILSQLLVSTAKTDALEAIQFFRLAYDLKVTSAKKGIRTMLHLIWTKDNASAAVVTTGGQTGQSVPQSEEMDGKGVRASVIETYRSLYFEPRNDLTPAQQVVKVTQNMLEYAPYLLIAC